MEWLVEPGVSAIAAAPCSRHHPIRHAGLMRSRWFGAVVAVLGLLLTGCSGGSDYPTQTAATLQSQVLSIAASAKSHDYAGALRRLTQLQQADDAALSAGHITRARHDAILATIVQVRADLTALQAATHVVVAPTPQPSHHKKDGGDGKGNGNGNGGD